MSTILKHTTAAVRAVYPHVFPVYELIPVLFEGLPCGAFARQSIRDYIVRPQR